MPTKLTDKTIAATIRLARETGETSVVYDAIAPGLHIYAGKKRATWQVVHRVDGKQRRLRIGHYPSMPLAEARAEAVRIQEAAWMGRDIQTEREQERREAERQAERQRTMRLAAVVDEHIARVIEPKHKAAASTISMLHRDFTDLLGDRMIDEIKRLDVQRCIDKVVDRGSPSSAVRLLAHIKSFFSWAVDRGYIEQSPTIGMRTPQKKVMRDRVLDFLERRALWAALDKIDGRYAAAIRFLALTAARRGEVVAARWEHIDHDKRVWVIPAENSKNGMAHEIWLSDQSLEVIESVRATGARGPIVFGGSAKLPSWSHRKDQLDRLLPDIDPWTYHDLRRTAATGMAALGHTPEVVERVLNHKSRTAGAMAAVYQRFEYADEQRAAWADWGANLLNDLDDVRKVRRAGKRPVLRVVGE